MRIALTGSLLFIAAAAWIAIAALAVGTPMSAYSTLIVAGGLAVGLSWVASSVLPVLVPAAIVGTAIGLLVGDVGSPLRYSPLGGPFGYANATAAFFVQSTVAALILTAAARSRALRICGGIAAAICASVVLMSRSWTGVIVLLVVVLAPILLMRARGAGAAIVACAAMFVCVLLLTLLLAAVQPGRGEGLLDRAIRATISEERVMLWHDALVLTAEHPLLGVGPGNFSSASLAASSDEDLRWAHHEFLQTAAESGVTAYVLLVGLFLWGFASLWQAPRGLVSVLGASGLSALGIHASVDYILRFPAVALAGAALFGAAIGISHREGSRTDRRDAVSVAIGGAS